MLDVTKLRERGDKLFSDRARLMTLWQEIALNFYPERADFTWHRTLGEDFASHLTSSYPVIVRRELGDAISGMLRPQGQQWVTLTIDDDDRLDNSGRRWLERATKVQMRAMYDRASHFVRATKEADHDFATFGQCVISKQVQWDKVALLYRSWHLRDVVWCEGDDCEIYEIHRNWEPTARDLVRKFGKDSVHAKVNQALDREPLRTFKCRHVVMATECYQGDQHYDTPFVSIWVDLDDSHVIKEEPVADRVYTIPRWQTVSGSQYAYSPASVAGLPDARLIQAMTLTLLEAGEMAVRPPLLAQSDVVRSDVAMYAGGVTWIDREYDERLGEALRPLVQDHTGMPFGQQFESDRREMIARAFYLNKLSLPPPDRTMTAYETGQRLQEWIRNALPLFEPMEQEYNLSLCDSTFEELMRVGAFGPARDIPPSLRGASVRFKFESPLHQAIERQKGTQFQQSRDLLLAAAQIDPGCIATLDARYALRDALNGIGISPKWLRDEADAEQRAQQMEAQQQQAQATEAARAQAESVQAAGQASQTMDQAA